MPWYKPSSGGVVIAVERMSRELIKKGHEALVLINGSSDQIIHVEDDDGVPVYSAKLRFFYWHKAPITSFIGWLVHLIPTVLRLRKFVKEQKVDIIAVHYPGAWAVHFMFLRMFCSVPYVVCVHGTDVHRNLLEHWSTRFGIGKIICYSDCLISCSQNLLETAQTNLRCKPRRTTVIFNGLSLDWGDITDRSGRTDGYIISQGLPHNVKGGDILVRAFAAIAPEYPNIRLKIIGQGETETLTRLVRELGVQNQVEILGLVPLDQIPNLFNRSMFGVIASRREGLPLAALELQYLQRPIIATAVGGLPECVEDNISGFLVPPENPLALAIKMKTLLDNEPLRTEMGEEGRRNVIEKFEIGRTVDAHLELFAQIIA